MKILLLKIVDLLNVYPIFNKYTRNTATIFMMHAISPDDAADSDAATPSLLRSYFSYLKKHNYHVVSLTSYIKALLCKESTYKQVIFTVDDGYRDFYLNGYEAFKEFNYPATIFLTTDFIEQKLFFWWDAIKFACMTTKKKKVALPEIGLGSVDLNSKDQKKKIVDLVVDRCKKMGNSDKLSFIDSLAKRLDVNFSGQPKGKNEPLSWDQIKEMKEHKIEFYPHTKTHPIMSRVPTYQVQEELEIPKKLLEKKLGINANIFCYPNGGPEDFDERTISALKALDYIAAVTGLPGFENTMSNTKMFEIRRFHLPYNPMYFKQYISGLERFKSIILRGN